MGRLDNKVALITGAAGGQGAAEARRFVAEGASVMLTDVDPGGQTLAEELDDGRAAWCPLDVTDVAAWQIAIQTTVARFGGLDVLVNNAGIFNPKPLTETTPAEFDRHYRINQLGCFLGIQAAIAPMRSRGAGSIINTSSIVGLMGGPGVSAYAATKFAVRGLTHCAAIELAPHHIRVNSIHPGVIRTHMLDVVPGPALEHMLTLTPLGRVGEPEEVAALAAFLASDESSYCTGAEFRIDGGASA